MRSRIPESLAEAKSDLTDVVDVAGFGGGGGCRSSTAVPTDAPARGGPLAKKLSISASENPFFDN
jgi:hypothetical protein